MIGEFPGGGMNNDPKLLPYEGVGYTKSIDGEVGWICGGEGKYTVAITKGPLATASFLHVYKQAVIIACWRESQKSFFFTLSWYGKNMGRAADAYHLYNSLPNNLDLIAGSVSNNFCASSIVLTFRTKIPS